VNLSISWLNNKLVIAAIVFCLATHASWLPNAAHGQVLDSSDAEEVPSKEQLDYFETKIRPVLVAECYECHSQSASEKGKLRGELWLDSRQGIRKGGETGPAVVPHRVEDSLLVSALKHDSFEMPPKGKLSDEIISSFVKWIEMGAPDPREGEFKPKAAGIDLEQGRQYWAFQPLRDQLPNDSADGPTPYHPVDRLIVQKQFEKGLTPSPTAEARVLIRRAWFDLLGIPPTPQEIQEWTGRLEKSGEIDQTAWSALIDTLLKRPEYGERWARHWMDIARFAESYGYEQDYDRPTAYHYRDFLIRAFNSDMPFDQFVQWQMAGDELAPQEPMAWMATGLLCGGPFPTQLTEAEFESTRYDELDDMVTTTSLAFLGISVGCARCHDHKFDPISSKDYYQYAANFTSAIRSEHELDLAPEDNETKRQAYIQRLTEARNLLVEIESGPTSTELLDFLQSPNTADLSLQPWTVLIGEVASTAGSKFQLQSDQSYLALGTTPAADTISLRASCVNQTMRAVRIEALTDPSLPQKGPGRAPNGNFALSRIELYRIAAGSTEPEKLPILAATATHQQNETSLSIASSLDDDPATGWAVDGQIGQNQAAVFQLPMDVRFGQGDQLKVVLAFNHPNPQHSLGRFRVACTSQSNLKPEVGNAGPTQQVVAAIEGLRSQAKAQAGLAELKERMPDEWRVAQDWFKPKSAKWKEQFDRIAEIEKAGSGVTLTKVLVTSEGLPLLSHNANARGYPHFYPETYLLRRGDVHQKVEIVTPGFPNVLTNEDADLGRWQLSAETQSKPETSKSSLRRSALARWMTDTELGAGNLVARVIVNRLWQHHFGRGIVSTPNDFGASGEKPTHPELLDRLAKRLIERGWRLSEIHRLMMSSKAYQQSNKLADDPRSIVDPENIYFWHCPPRRLEAEPIRDSMLFVSGLLDPSMYGPGTLDSSMRRRSIYFFIKRSQLIPEMMLFDWPEHLVSIGQRASTTIAPQALLFINSPHSRTYAEAFAKRIQSAEPNASIVQAYMTAFGRPPSSSELQIAEEFLRKQAETRKSSGDAEADFQALADLCQAIFSMNEFVYID
jgi:Protein of unknown function (DUF1553)/Protein of unknown function (DUF1549)/Planctomycete cytochrome C